MALPIADDLDAILNVDEFALTATYIAGNFSSKTTINGIFDNETIPVDSGGLVSVHQEQPRFTCRTIDAPSIAEGDILSVSGVEYKVVAWVHDGTGVTVLQLEKQ